MPKPEYLLQFKAGQKMVGFIYVENNDKSKIYDFKVKTNISNQKEWNEISVENVVRFRDGGTTLIHLMSNNDRFAKIYIPFSERKEVPYIEMENGRIWYLDDLDLEKYQYTDINGTFIPTVPFIPISLEEQQEKIYNYNDLLKAINVLTKVYDVTTRSDIFEHTMLRLSGVSFPFNGYYKFARSQRTPDYFFMDLGLTETKVKEFVRILNEKYGTNTAEYMPHFNQGPHYAVCLKISTIIEKILPLDFKANLEKTFSDEKMKQAYQKPYNELDNDLQNYITRSLPNIRLKEEPVATLLSQFSFISKNQEKLYDKEQCSMPTTEEIATAIPALGACRKLD